jgi:transcription-repair coupling factor (superfamily II helicase)
MNTINKINQILIASITPYFLEKGFVWYQENLDQVLKAQKSRSFFQDNTIYIERDQSIGLSEVLRKLDELGYEKVMKITDPGEFSQVGGIIEVFPINTKNAVRLDFLGNKIESIELLDLAVEDEGKSKELLKKKLKSQKLFSDLKGLKVGDYLVHLDHGIGKYVGNEKIEEKKPAGQIDLLTNIGRQHENAFYILEYAQGDKLYVPFGLERKLSRYVGFSDPAISRLGSGLWQRTKRKAKEESEKLAKELLAIYAARETTQRSPYLPDDEIDRELAASFKYEETPDQAQAIEEIKIDLEKIKPMDRLVCGDVGFGKTEVALRAAMKVIKSGSQVVFMSPTTILANQHFHNFRKRLENFPVRIAMLTRLQSNKEQKEIIEDLKNNEIDILIGTHRILSNDIIPLLFSKNGHGLLIIDDEQMFGVRQKEKIKQLKSKIDILSLSATPIPRTLYLSLSSLREVSLIQTPPQGRLAVKTLVKPASEKIIKEAIQNEVMRGGQVYYLYNRVETIDLVKKALEELLPDIKVRVAHGRVSEKELVRIMDDFENKKFDVLVATTIIENGLDISNVNTLIVADATKLGLSQAYQIRGRVGRAGRQAYAYFLYNEKKLQEKAANRMAALKEAEELGSGYRIAMRDLEMRGAGNILGKEQSGSVNKIGLNLYCQILSEAVEKLKQNLRF